jgi:4-amino-4-deoxy-L-arabinose transferase-like glycosyltransferase
MTRSSDHCINPLIENKWLQVVSLWAICCCSFFVHSGAHDVDLMEARNFVTAREIVNDNNWLIPTLNGEIRIAKPPLPTWITAMFRIVGGNKDNNALMRLPAGLAATLMVFSLMGLTRMLTEDRRVPFMAAAVLATCVVIIDNGRRGSWDIYCHSFMMTAIWALAYGWRKKRRTAGAFFLSGVFMAFSFMSKGPVSFYSLLLPFLTAYIIFFGYRPIIGKWKELVFALAVFAVLSGLWPLAIFYQYPELSKTVAATEVTSWADRHVRPFYFYLSFPLYAGIWSVTVVSGFVKPYAEKRTAPYTRYGFVLVWMILSLVLLSIIPEKKERYLVPAFVPMAIMAATLFRSLIQQAANRTLGRGDGRLLGIHTVLAGLITLSIPFVVYMFGLRKNLITPMAGAGWSLIFLSMALLIFFFGIRKNPLKLFTLSLLSVCLINLTLPMVIYRSPLFRKNPEFRSLRDVRELKELAGLNYYHIGDISPIEVWDIGKRVKPIKIDNGSFPLDDLPLALFSDTEPFSAIPEKLRRVLEIHILDQFKYDPRHSNRIKYVALVRRGAKE